jgi:hypothetical protein
LLPHSRRDRAVLREVRDPAMTASAAARASRWPSHFSTVQQ